MGTGSVTLLNTAISRGEKIDWLSEVDPHSYQNKDKYDANPTRGRIFTLYKFPNTDRSEQTYILTKGGGQESLYP